MILLLQLVMTYCFAISFPADQVRQIRVSGFDANLVVTAKEGQGLVQVADGVSTKLTGDGALIIDLPKPNQISAWRQWIFGQGQKVSFEIISPSKKIDYNVYQGTLTIKNWQQDLNIKTQKGKLNLSNGRGQLQIYNHKGDTTVDNQNGSVILDAYSGSVQLKNINGDVQMRLFTGTVLLEKLVGHVEADVFDGQVKSLQGTGTFEFDINRGQINVQSQSGRVEGTNVEGSLNIQMMNESDLYVTSKSGKVVVTAPSGSGMAYLLATQEGDIWVSETKVKGDGEKSLRGRLAGQQSKGNIVVRGQDVNINLK